MTRYWKIRAGRGGECWETWKNRSIISVGWDIGEVSGLSWEKTRKRIEDKYPDRPAGYATGIIRRFAGLIDGSGSEPLKEGDIAIVLGSAAVLDIAKIGEYEYYHERVYLPIPRTLIGGR